MKGTRAAQRYAKAVLALAKEKNSAEAVKNDMQDIFKTILGSQDLRNALKSPVMKSSLKKSLLLEIFKKKHAITIGTFDILIENGRINILDLVAKQYVVQYNEMNRTQEAVVTTVVPLTRELEAKILQKVEELTGTGASIKNIIDESIIGGFVLRVGDLQYNASVANNLDRLKREFKNNTYISKI